VGLAEDLVKSDPLRCAHPEPERLGRSGYISFRAVHEPAHRQREDEVKKTTTAVKDFQTLNVRLLIEVRLEASVGYADGRKNRRILQHRAIRGCRAAAGTRRMGLRTR